MADSHAQERAETSSSRGGDDEVPSQAKQVRLPPPQGYGPSDVRRLDRKPRGRPLVALGVCVALVAAVVLFIRWRDARFVTVVSPIAAPSVRDCTAVLKRENGGAWAKPCEDHLTDQAWFQVRVTNVGHSSGNIACSIRAFDASGHVLFFGARPPTPNGAMATVVDAGQVVTWDYYLPPSVKDSVDRYQGTCVATENPVI